MTKNKFKTILNGLEKNKNINESEIQDFVETCRKLIIYHLYAYGVMKVKKDNKVFEEEGC